MMRFVAALVVACGVLALMGAAQPVWADEEATVEVRGTTVVQPGERIGVVAENWPTNSVVTFEICGQLAIDGTADCDMATSRSAGVGSEGRTGASLEVPEPPSPCPCVVRASSTSTTRVVTASLDIQGVPFEPVQVDPARLNPPNLEIRTAHLRSTSGWAALFGGRPEVVAVLTLANTGSGPVEQVPVTVLYGRGDHPSRMGGEPAVDRLDARQERRAEVPFRMDPMSFGTYTVRIEVGDAARQVVVVREFTTYPWGLLLLAAIGLFLLVRVGLHRLRPRSGGDDGESLHDVEPDPTGPEGPTESISQPPSAQPAREDAVMHQTASPGGGPPSGLWVSRPASSRVSRRG